MINNYYRPASVEEAIEFLTDEKMALRPLGGGTSISRNQEGEFGVVDLQAAGLDQMIEKGQKLQVGAMVRLHNLLDHPDVHPELKRAILIDSSENIRNMATLGGWLVSANGRSITSTLLLVLDATLTWQPGDNVVRLGDWLPLRGIDTPGVLITAVQWGLKPHLAFEYAARSPKDKPIVIAAAAQWGSGRTRIALGGYGKMPIIAMDGRGDDDVVLASQNAYADADDQWASADYRRDVAGKLASRCLERIEHIKESEV